MDSHNETKHCCYQRLGDTTRHKFWIACTEERNRLERVDHTGDGTEQLPSMAQPPKRPLPPKEIFPRRIAHGELLRPA